MAFHTNFSRIFHPCKLVPHFHVSHFQSPRASLTYASRGKKLTANPGRVHNTARSAVRSRRHPIHRRAGRQVSASVVLRRDTAMIVSRPAINSLAVRPTDRPRFHKSQVIRRRRNPPARRGRPASLIAVAISVCCASQGGRGAGVGVSRADGPRARRRRTDGYRHRQRIYLLAASVCGKNTGGLGQTIHAQPLTTPIVTLQMFSSSCSM